MNPFHLMLLYLRERRRPGKPQEYDFGDIKRELAAWRRRLIGLLAVMLALLALGGLIYWLE